MSPPAEKLRTELRNLSDAERAELAHFLIWSLDHGSDPDSEAAWETELTRRTKEIKTGGAKGEPAEKVFSKLRAKYS